MFELFLDILAIMIVFKLATHSRSGIAHRHKDKPGNPLPPEKSQRVAAIGKTNDVPHPTTPENQLSWEKKQRRNRSQCLSIQPVYAHAEILHEN